MDNNFSGLIEGKTNNNYLEKSHYKIEDDLIIFKNDTNVIDKSSNPSVLEICYSILIFASLLGLKLSFN